jgi:hypothetical protein
MSAGQSRPDRAVNNANTRETRDGRESTGDRDSETESDSDAEGEATEMDVDAKASGSDDEASGQDDDEQDVQVDDDGGAAASGDSAEEEEEEEEDEEDASAAAAAAAADQAESVGSDTTLQEMSAAQPRHPRRGETDGAGRALRAAAEWTRWAEDSRTFRLGTLFLTGPLSHPPKHTPLDDSTSL